MPHPPRNLYALSAFRKEFRKWQSAAPAEARIRVRRKREVLERQGRIPRPDILVLETARRCAFVAATLKLTPSASRPDSLPAHNHRKPNGGSYSRAGAACSPSQPSTFASTIESLSSQTGWLGDLTTFVAPRPLQDAALVRLQCSARPGPDRPAESCCKNSATISPTARMTRAPIPRLRAQAGTGQDPPSNPQPGSGRKLPGMGSVVWAQAHTSHRPNPATMACSPLPTSLQRHRAKRRAAMRQTRSTAC